MLMDQPRKILIAALGPVPCWRGAALRCAELTRSTHCASRLVHTHKLLDAEFAS